MTGVRIGSKECPTEELIEVFKCEDVKQIELGEFPVISQWANFAKCLDLPADLLETFLDLIQKGNTERYKAIGFILRDWIKRDRDKATIGTALDIVKRNFKWEIVTEFLQKKIQAHAKNFEDLDADSRKKLLDLYFEFLGRQTNLKSLQALVSEEIFKEILKTIDNNYIVEVLQNNWRRFEEFKLPPESSHYTNRTVEIKRKLNAEIFQKACEDVFIFEATLPDNHDLSILVRPHAADVSGAQVHSLSVRFILLEEEEHFAEIVRKTKKPVHRIKYHENSLLWVRTIGSIKVIREFLSAEIEEVNEDNLISGKLSDFDSKPLAICGGPGTGKSVLLASLANQIFQKYSSRYTVFLNFPSIVRQLTLPGTTDESVDDTGLLTAIFGRIFKMHNILITILQGLMTNKETYFEIFLDGFDEISFEKVDLAKDFLQRFLKYTNLRIYLAFSPSVRVDLENHLQVISWEISPFQKDDIEFFVSNMADSDSCQMVLKSVEMLGKNTNMHEETAGSPLQCSMLAEVYLESQQKELKASRETGSSKYLIKSLTELYSKYVEIRLHKEGNHNFQLFKLLHYREAFNKLFYDNMDAQTIISNLNKQINQFPLSYASFEPFFEHKTFSEFLVAQYVAENLKGSTTGERSTLCTFLYRTLLTTCKTEKYIENPETFRDLENDTLKSVLLKKDTDKIFIDEAAVTLLVNLGWSRTLEYLQISILKEHLAFRHPAICYFLNEILSNDASFSLESNMKGSLAVCSSLHENFGLISKDFISKVLLAVSFSYKHLFRVTAESFREITGSKLSFIDPQTYQALLILAARLDDVQTFQYFSASVEANGSTNIATIRFHSDILKNMVYEHTPLHEAAKRGNYIMFEYLFNVYENRRQLMSGLAQVCLSGSSQNSKDVITNKNKILRLLSSENIKYDFKDLETSFLDGVHVVLFTKVCEMIGYTLSEKDVKWLYKFVVYYFTSDEQMDIFVKWIISKDLTRLLLHFYEKQHTLVIDAIRQNVLGPKSLERIYNSQCFDLGLIAYSVTKSKNQCKLMTKMMHLIGEVSLTDPSDPTILHWATSMFDFDPMKFLAFDKSDRANISQRMATHKTNNVKLYVDEIRRIIGQPQPVTDSGQIEYNSNEVLGKGAFGTVYRGKLNKRDVAVKKVYFNAKQEEKVDQEAKLLLECDGHENIIKCFYIQKSAHAVLIALEICDFTLEKYVQTSRSAEVKPEALRIMYQATKGVEYLHSKKVVHLDITPQNILLGSSFDDIKVKISDFGNSRNLSVSNTRIKLEDGAGTKEWMAPEVIRMTSQQNHGLGQKLSTPADIFSLGCVFYYVLSNGVHPFGDKGMDIESNILLNKPSVQRSILKQPLFVHLFHLMTSQYPDTRPTASALLKHHIFWSEKTMLGFLVAVSNAADQTKVTSKISKIMTKIEKYQLLKPYYESEPSKGWTGFLCVDVQNYVLGIGCKRKPYAGDLFFDLVRAIRNMQAHMQELPENVQAAVGAVPNNFMKYWLKRFAIVFEIVWLHFEVMKHDTSSALLEYYSNEYDFNREEISEKADKILSKYIAKQCAQMILREVRSK